MGTVEKYTTPSGREGYMARDSYVDARGKRVHARARFRADQYGGLKKARAEADAWLAQREADRSRGVIWQPSQETLGSLLDRWAASLGPPLAGATVFSYRGAVERRFDARARGIPVGSLTPADARRLMREWERSGLSASACRLGWLSLRASLKLARDEGGIQHNPLDGIKGPGAPPMRDAVWSPEQVRRFLNHTEGDPFGFAWALMFASCCRIGELCGLQWSDVDFDAATVAIRRSWGKDERGGLVVQTATKTKTHRVIPLPAGIVHGLARVRLARSFDDGGWVMALPRRRVTPRVVREAWRLAVRSSGLPVLTPHGARHSGATNMITAGVPVSVVARILGHSDPAMTLRRYIHPDTSDDEAAILVLDSLYESASGVQKASNVVELKKKAQ